MAAAKPPINWPALAQLRSTFLDQSFPKDGYWSSNQLLADYDRTFAERIGWKWDAVFAELKLRGWQAPCGEVLDWGCGSGIASRKYVDFVGVDRIEQLTLWDARERAVQFAEARLRDDYPKLAVRRARQVPMKKAGVLLVSHVLNELDDAALDQLVSLASRSQAVIWVEPGTHAESRKLSAVRDRLLKILQPFAPCTHAAPCPMQSHEENERHWCHHFARPPGTVHQDPHWSAFTRELGIDMGTVPYAFLAMVGTESEVPGETAESDVNVRVIGHPRSGKGYMRLLCCSKLGLSDWSLAPSADKAIYKEVKKERGIPLLRCEVQNQRIRRARRW